MEMSLWQFVIKYWYLFVPLVAVISLLLAGPLIQLKHGIKNLNPAQAVQMVNRDSGVFVDVCEPHEYKQGHIPNAVNLPLSHLKENLKHIEKYKNKPIVVSCRSGNRSVKGAVLLRKQGFATVYSLGGGLASWQRDQLPLEKS
jgi:rhodanese-related sulfurtransferase